MNVKCGLFETIIMILIIGNVTCLSLKNPDFSDITNERLEFVNNIFLFLFIIELLFFRILSIVLYHIGRNHHYLIYLMVL